MTERTRGRPRKYTVDEARERLFAVARSALRDQGITAGMSAVKLDGAIQEAKVPRGSAYRMWQHDTLSPQDAFRREVILDFVRHMSTSSGLPDAAKAYQDVMPQLLAHADPDDRDRTNEAIVELTRVIASHNFEQLDRNHDWQVYCAIRASATTQLGDDPELEEAIRTGEEKLLESYAALFEEAAEVFGYQLMPGLTFIEFTAAAYAMNDGLANRPARNFRRREIPLPTGPDGEEQPWTLLAIGFHALCEYFFEPVDAAEPSDAA